MESVYVSARLNSYEMAIVSRPPALLSTFVHRYGVGLNIKQYERKDTFHLQYCIVYYNAAVAEFAAILSAFAAVPDMFIQRIMLGVAF